MDGKDIDEDWPFVSGSDSESDEHVKLKSLAVYWLLSLGFKVGEIQEEHPIKKQNRSGRGSTMYTDIYAEQDGLEVFVECERGYHTSRDISGGGSVPARNGELVYLFKEDGIFRVKEKTTTLEHTWKDETMERDVLEIERIRNLPMVDFSAFEF